MSNEIVTTDNVEPIFNHSAHIALWNWLADNPGKWKKDWPEWTSNGGTIVEVTSDCFACDYAKLYVSKVAYSCKYCPFGELYAMKCLGGLFDSCRILTTCYNRNIIIYSEEISKLYKSDKLDRLEISKLAKQIRDLPIRTDIEVKTI